MKQLEFSNLESLHYIPFSWGSLNITDAARVAYKMSYDADRHNPIPVADLVEGNPKVELWVIAPGELDEDSVEENLNNDDRESLYQVIKYSEIDSNIIRIASGTGVGSEILAQKEIQAYANNRMTYGDMPKEGSEIACRALFEQMKKRTIMRVQDNIIHSFPTMVIGSAKPWYVQNIIESTPQAKNKDVDELANNAAINLRFNVALGLNSFLKSQRYS